MDPDESATLYEVCAVPMRHTSSIFQDAQDVPVRHTRSTHEGVQYWWRECYSFAIHQKSLMGTTVVLHMRVCCTCEAHPQYLEGTPTVSMRVWAVSLRHTQSTHEGNYIHLPFIKSHSWVLCASKGLDMLTGTSGVPHEYCTYIIQGDIGSPLH